MLQHTSTGQPFTGRTSQLLIVSLLACLFLSLLMSVMKGGDPTSALAVLCIFAVYIGSSELLGIFIVMAPISLVTDILFLAFHEGHKGAPVHGFGIFINVVCMITKIVATVLAYQLKKEVASGEYSPIVLPPGSPSSSAVPVSLPPRPQTSYQPPPPSVNGNPFDSLDTYQTFPSQGQGQGQQVAPFHTL